jgi:hypothetical protein
LTYPWKITDETKAAASGSIYLRNKETGTAKLMTSMMDFLTGYTYTEIYDSNPFDDLSVVLGSPISIGTGSVYFMEVC